MSTALLAGPNASSRKNVEQFERGFGRRLVRFDRLNLGLPQPLVRKTELHQALRVLHRIGLMEHVHRSGGDIRIQELTERFGMHAPERTRGSESTSG